MEGNSLERDPKLLAHQPQSIHHHKVELAEFLATRFVSQPLRRMPTGVFVFLKKDAKHAQYRYDPVAQVYRWDSGWVSYRHHLMEDVQNKLQAWSDALLQRPGDMDVVRYGYAVRWDQQNLSIRQWIHYTYLSELKEYYDTDVHQWEGPDVIARRSGMSDVLTPYKPDKKLGSHWKCGKGRHDIPEYRPDGRCGRCTHSLRTAPSLRRSRRIEKQHWSKVVSDYHTFNKDGFIEWDVDLDPDDKDSKNAEHPSMIRP